MERSGNNGNNFEKQWRKALLQGEIAPPESVWGEVDRKLANQEVSQLRKKAVLYKWAAVVGMLLAFSFALTNVLDIKLITLADESITDRISVEEAANPSTIRLDIGANPLSNSASELEDNSKPEQKSQGIVLTEREENAVVSSGAAVEEHTENQSVAGDIVKIDKGISTLRVIGLYDEKEESKKMLASKKPRKLYLFEKFRVKKNKAFEKEKFWASVGMGSGTFDPNYQQTSNNSVASAMLSAEQSSFVNVAGGRTAVPRIEENIEQGVNYQIGVNLGMQVLDRVVVETGVQYAVAQTTTNTNIIIQNRFFTESVALTSEAATIDAVAAIADQQEIIEYKQDDIALSNTFQFASVPVKAGYILVDKKFNLRVNAGMLTNLYLGNTLREQDEIVAALEISPGGNSPYREVSFTGTTGLTLGYRFKDRLNLTIEPNYQHAITPLTKGSSNFDFSPSGFGLMAGVRYRLF